MTQIFGMSLVCGALAIVAPLSAQATEEPSKAPTTQPSGSEAGAREPEKTIRYCVVQTTTGTHIPKKTCKTREDWLKLGVDPTRPD